MSNQDLVFYVQLHVKPDRILDWREAFEKIASAMSGEDAFVSCHLHQDAQDECLFTLYERWAEPSAEAFIANQMKPYRVEYDARLDDLLQRPRVAQVLRPLGQWNKGGA